MSLTSNSDVVNTNQLKERFLECKICQEEFNEDLHTPKLLPCLHTFCSDCLRKLLKTNVIECPFCRSKHQFNSAEDVDECPKDNTRRDLLQFVGKSNSDIICKACEDKNKALYRCRNCADFLCEDCKLAHRRTKYTRDHKILRIEELKSDPELLKEFIYEGFCTVPGHETVPLKLYCAAAECCKPICFNCAVSDHRDPIKHPVQNIAEVYENKKQFLETNLGDVRKTRQEIIRRKERIDKETVKVQPFLEQVASDIETAFETSIKLLEARKNQLKKDAKDILTKKKAKLENQSSSYLGYIERLDASIRFTEETLIYKDVSGLLEIEETIKKRLRNLQEERLVEEPQTNAQLQFNKTKMSTEFESFCGSMGSIISTEAYPPNTKIHVSNDLQEDRESTININLFTVTHEPVTDQDIGLQVEIKDNDGKQNNSAVRFQSGSFLANFTPKVAGSYHVTIRAFGGKLLLGVQDFEVKQTPEVIHEAENRKAHTQEFDTKHVQIVKSDRGAKEGGEVGVFGVSIDVKANENYSRRIEYKFQGNVLSTQHIHHEGCKSCKSILHLLRRANEKGVLFKKIGGNEITWNEDIPYERVVVNYFDNYFDRRYYLSCDDYLPKLKQSLAKYGIE